MSTKFTDEFQRVFDRLYKRWRPMLRREVRAKTTDEVFVILRECAEKAQVNLKQQLTTTKSESKKQKLLARIAEWDKMLAIMDGQVRVPDELIKEGLELKEKIAMTIDDKNDAKLAFATQVGDFYRHTTGPTPEELKKEAAEFAKIHPAVTAEELIEYWNS